METARGEGRPGEINRLLMGTWFACSYREMAVHDLTPLDSPFDLEDSGPEEELTSDECDAIRAAAEAEGYSETFADLLCRFAELMGPEQVLLELGQLNDRLKEE